MSIVPPMSRFWQQGQCRCNGCCHFRTRCCHFRQYHCLRCCHSGPLLPLLLPFPGVLLPFPLPPRQHSLEDRRKSVRSLTWILILAALGKYAGWFMVLADFRPVVRTSSQWSTPNHPAQVKPPIGPVGPRPAPCRQSHASFSVRRGEGACSLRLISWLVHAGVGHVDHRLTEIAATNGDNQFAIYVSVGHNGAKY